MVTIVVIVYAPTPSIDRTRTKANVRKMEMKTSYNKEENSISLIIGLHSRLCLLYCSAAPTNSGVGWALVTNQQRELYTYTRIFNVHNVVHAT